MSKYFENFDFSGFWIDNNKETAQKVSNELIESVESELGLKLPDSYIEFMKMFNGGTPEKNCFPTKTQTSWADDHVAIFEFLELDSIALETEFMKDEWGYPDIGIYICDCPSAGHDIIMLDYRTCGKNGEPEVVHVDQSFDYKVTFLAKDFESFIKNLKAED